MTLKLKNISGQIVCCITKEIVNICGLKMVYVSTVCCI